VTRRSHVVTSLANPKHAPHGPNAMSSTRKDVRK
jgi:hypothetical protein